MLVILVLASLGESSCSDDFLDGKLCTADGGCLPGYLCDPTSNRCLRQLEGGDPDGDGGDGDGDGDGQPSCTEAAGGQVILTDVSLSGNGARVAVPPGTVVNVLVDYSLSQVTDCPQCVNLFLFGLASAGYGNEPEHCHRAGIPPPCPGLLTGQASFDVTAPQTPGTYQVLAAVAQADDCSAALGEYQLWMERRAAQAAVVDVIAPSCSDWMFYLSEVSLAEGGPQARLAIGENVDFSATFVAAGMESCPQCQAIVVIGIEDVPQLCHEAGILPRCPSVAQGQIAGVLAAPDKPGQYTVRATMVANVDCAAAFSFYRSNPPPRTHTVAVLEVVE